HAISAPWIRPNAQRYWRERRPWQSTASTSSTRLPTTSTPPGRTRNCSVERSKLSTRAGVYDRRAVDRNEGVSVIQLHRLLSPSLDAPSQDLWPGRPPCPNSSLSLCTC